MKNLINKPYSKNILILILILSIIAFNVISAKNHKKYTKYKKLKHRTNNPELLRKIEKHMNKCLISQETVCSITTFWIVEAFCKNEHSLEIRDWDSNIEEIRHELNNGKIIYISLESTSYIQYNTNNLNTKYILKNIKNEKKFTL